MAAVARIILLWLTVAVIFWLSLRSAVSLHAFAKPGTTLPESQHAPIAEMYFGPLRDRGLLPARVEWVASDSSDSVVWRSAVQYTLAPTLLDTRESHPVVIATFPVQQMLDDYLATQVFEHVERIGPGTVLAYRASSQPDQASPPHVTPESMVPPTLEGEP